MVCAKVSSCCKRRATSGRCKWASAAHSKNGISLSASTAISPRPHGSCVVGQGGGASMPVAHGESALKSQPPGASSATTPMAKAACGTASRGASQRARRCAGRGVLAEPTVADKTQAVPATASRVDTRPVHMLIRSARHVWGSENSAAHAAWSSPAVRAPHRLHTSGTAIRTSSTMALVLWVLACDKIMGLCSQTPVR